MQNGNIKNKILFNEVLIGALVLVLALYWLGISRVDGGLIALSLIGVVPVVISAIRSLFKKSVTIDLLASIALVFTIVQHQWVSSAFINLMLSSARLFSAFTDRKASNIISRLLKLRPTKVKIKQGEAVIEIPLEKIKVGDIVLVESGDRVAVDGVVIGGRASIDQSSLTGESEPVSKKEGSQVFSSTLCLSGSLMVKAEKVGEDTSLAKMIALVDEASRAKTRTETLANKFSAWYILATIIGSVAIFVATRNLNMVLSILLVTCADDLAVAVPLGFTMAISRAAKHGVVVKGAAIMERLKNIKIFVTDKTGTLTKGVARVVSVILFNGFQEAQILAAAGTASCDSKHPRSQAILKYVKENISEEIHAPDEAEEVPGEGIRVKHEGRQFLQGRESFLEESGVEISPEIKNKISEIQNQGKSLSLVSIDKKVAGLIVLEDEVRSHARSVIAETRQIGIKKWIMLTGDNPQVAEKVAREVGIDEFYAELKPADKIEHLKKIKQAYGDVAMIGDGVNDAAALALADVSFAMGAIGTDASIEAADIAIMHDDFKRIPEMIFLSRETLIITKQNFIIWAITNSLGLFLVFGGFIGPVGASAFNFITDFFPILNVFRIYSLKIHPLKVSGKNQADGNPEHIVSKKKKLQGEFIHDPLHQP